MNKFKILVAALGLAICAQAAYAVNTRDEITGVSTGGGGISDATFSAYTSNAVGEGDSPTFDTGTFNNLYVENTALGDKSEVIPGGIFLYENINRGLKLGGDGTNGYVNAQGAGFLSINSGQGVGLTSNALNEASTGALSSIVFSGTNSIAPKMSVGRNMPSPFTLEWGTKVTDEEAGGFNILAGDASSGATGVNQNGGDVTLGGGKAYSEGSHGRVTLKSYTTTMAQYGQHTTIFYPDSDNPIVVDSSYGSIKASVFSPYSTTTASAITLTGADTAWNCDITSNDVTFTLYSSGLATQGNSVEIVVTKPSGSNTCFVTAHGNQTVRSGSTTFDNHSGMDTDGEAFKYYDTGRGYFMIHGGY
jgi:hypothetical protein